MTDVVEAWMPATASDIVVEDNTEDNIEDNIGDQRLSTGLCPSNAELSHKVKSRSCTQDL